MNIPDKTTPFYYYDLTILDATITALRKANTRKYSAYYALKANTDQKILETLLAADFGADCVSGGEITRALEVGFAPGKIVFAGVGKSDQEIELGLVAGIGAFNVESLQEIEVINNLAQKKGVIAYICLRINPNIDAHTHDNITTGLEDNKFGIALGDVDAALELLKVSENVVFKGLHFHIGSQIEDVAIFGLLGQKAKEVVQQCTEQGFEVSILNLGGGLAVDYQNPKGNIANFAGYFEVINKLFEDEKGINIHFEFGRAIVAQCGFLVTDVLYTKKAGGREVVIVDAGFTELMRPALYDSYHYIENVSSTQAPIKYTIVGPICESTDTFAEDRFLAETKRGDRLVIYTAGAYGQTMSSEYNYRPKAPTYYNSQ